MIVFEGGSEIKADLEFIHHHFWLVQIIGVVAKIHGALRALCESLKSHLLLPKFIISMPAKLIVRFSYLMLASHCVKAAIATQNAFE